MPQPISNFALLLASLVTLAALLPPGVSHSHANGGRQHAHHDQWGDAEHAAYHERHGEHAHHHHEHGAAVEDQGPGQLAADEWHAHFDLFGITWSWPIPEGDQTRDLNGTSIVLLHWTNQTATPSLLQHDTTSIGSQSAEFSVGLDILALETQDRHLAARALPPPLCDSARQARSGVQLA